MIGCQGVQVSLGRKTVLHEVDLKVSTGHWLAIVGPNGAGKSTLLRYLTGSVRGSGEVTVDGQPLQSLGRRERAQRVAMVPQHPIIPDGITVADYVLLGRTPHIRSLAVEGPEDLLAAEEALERLDLLSFADRLVATLSGGERQRVFIARALAQGAPIMLLDEPTTALDVGHQQQVLEVVDELRRTLDLTVVTTMHDLTLAGQYADELLLLDHGHVVATGTAEQVLTPEHLETYYGASVRLIEQDGHLVVVPVRAPRSPS